MQVTLSRRMIIHGHTTVSAIIDHYLFTSVSLPSVKLTFLLLISYLSSLILYHSRRFNPSRPFSFRVSLSFRLLPPGQSSAPPGRQQKPSTCDRGFNVSSLLPLHASLHSSLFRRFVSSIMITHPIVHSLLHA